MGVLAKQMNSNNINNVEFISALYKGTDSLFGIRLLVVQRDGEYVGYVLNNSLILHSIETTDELAIEDIKSQVDGIFEGIFKIYSRNGEYVRLSKLLRKDSGFTKYHKLFFNDLLSNNKDITYRSQN